MPLERDFLLFILRGFHAEAHRAATLQVHRRLVLDGHLYLGAILREDVTELAFEVLLAENFADIAVHEDGVGTVGLADRLEEQPAAQEALCIRRRGGRGHGDEILVELGRGVGIDLCPAGESRHQERQTDGDGEGFENGFHKWYELLSVVHVSLRYNFYPSPGNPLPPFVDY